MTEARIAVDLFNPGQVFACLGLLEAADVLLGDAEGGFDWSDKTNVRFVLRAVGDKNPVEVVLDFLARAEIRRLAPAGYKAPPPVKNKKGGTEGPRDGDEQGNVTGAHDLLFSEWFPRKDVDRMTLPIQLQDRGGRIITLSHWADGSSRRDFKLYAGNRSAASIALVMLQGTSGKSRKKQSKGNVKTEGLAQLWARQPNDLAEKPFDVLTAMGGSFNFDPRGAWTSIDAGYSPNDQNHSVAASPVVEILAAIGLEHARPDEYETSKVRYGAWGAVVPPILARPALAGLNVGVPIRRFQFELHMSGKNRIVTFAQEEVNT